MEVAADVIGRGAVARRAAAERAIASDSPPRMGRSIKEKT
jgi:hypothetical protein